MKKIHKVNLFYTFNHNNVGRIFWKTKISLLVNRTLEDLNVTLIEEEQDLVVKMLSSEVRIAKTLKLSNKRLRSFSP